MANGILLANLFYELADSVRETLDSYRDSSSQNSPTHSALPLLEAKS